MAAEAAVGSAVVGESVFYPVNLCRDEGGRKRHRERWRARELKRGEGGGKGGIYMRVLSASRNDSSCCQRARVTRIYFDSATFD